MCWQPRQVPTRLDQTITIHSIFHPQDHDTRLHIDTMNTHILSPIFALYWTYLTIAFTTHALHTYRVFPRKANSGRLVQRWAICGAIIAAACIFRAKGIQPYISIIPSDPDYRSKRVSDHTLDTIRFISRWAGVFDRAIHGYIICLMALWLARNVGIVSYTIIFVTIGPGGRDIRRTFHRDWRKQCAQNLPR